MGRNTIRSFMRRDNQSLLLYDSSVIWDEDDF